MACCTGQAHTVCLSDDGVVYTFGRNCNGQLGLGYKSMIDVVAVPTAIPNIPKIIMISCGNHFTVCLDETKSIWSFGENNSGQLGYHNQRHIEICYRPKKIQNIPKVKSISCGGEHTLFITTDLDLWAFGSNGYGQLFLGTKSPSYFNEFIDQKPQKTKFFDVSIICGGSYSSIMQNKKEEIYTCGINRMGQLGLGHFNSPIIEPCIISNPPLYIKDICCGIAHSLFLDVEGNVYSTGDNEYGNLGLAHNQNVNELTQIMNIPPIQFISCIGQSSYLIDFEGNLWSFGFNLDGQLGFEEDAKYMQIEPIMANCFSNIQQVAKGCCGNHCLVNDSQNNIFVMGNNNSSQLGRNGRCSVLYPRKMDPKYLNIWGEPKIFNSKAKSARK